jgi:hypothetical protein
VVSHKTVTSENVQLMAYEINVITFAVNVYY